MPAQKKNLDREAMEKRISPLWEGARRVTTFEELAEEYHISPDEQLAGVIGGFSEEEFEGFDEALEQWRREGL